MHHPFILLSPFVSPSSPSSGKWLQIELKTFFIYLPRASHWSGVHPSLSGLPLSPHPYASMNNCCMWFHILREQCHAICTYLPLCFFLLHIMLLRFLPVDMYTFSSFILMEGLYILYESTTVIYPFSVGRLSVVTTDITWVHLLEQPGQISLQHTQ